MIISAQAPDGYLHLGDDMTSQRAMGTGIGNATPVADAPQYDRPPLDVRGGRRNSDRSISGISA
jgi:hypothetical protein